MRRVASTRVRSAIYYAVLALCTVVVFVANSHHHNQQGIFYLWHLPLAQEITLGHGYTYPAAASAALDDAPAHLQASLQGCIERGQTFDGDNGKAATYPVWGYAALAASLLLVGLNPTLWILVLQGLMCIGSTWCLYRAYDLQERFWHIVLFFPWLALFSVRWPDAVAAFLFCVIVFLLQRLASRPRNVHLILAAVAFGLMPSFRSEYVWLWGFVAATLVPLLPRLWLPGPQWRRTSWLMFCGIGVAIYLPWIVQISDHERVRATSTNSGAVLYISLGQLPSNPWDRSHADIEAFTYARSHGVQNALGKEGDELLTKRFIEDIRAFPGAFVRKVLGNLNRCIDGAFYTGEYETLAATQSDITGRLAGIVQWFSGKSFSAYRWLFRFGELYLLILLAVPSARKRSRPWRMAIVLTGLLLASKLVIHSVSQYEPRHMQILWLPLIIPILQLLSGFSPWSKARTLDHAALRALSES